MPDFDVEARSLASPPVAAPVTTYRPAVRVRNNGIHPADVTGYLRIYRREPPGELLATHQLSLLNLGAGLEGDALSSGYWTPTAADVGREFLFTARVDTTSDQVPGNNDLSPVTVIVTAGEPPPPPGVLAHATQHEAGGGDQVELTGLHGLAADAQSALAHKTTHQAGGADAINVDGLLGTLAQGQPIATHKETHEDNGDDQLNVDGLHGQLHNVQKPDLHDNSAHDPNYTTVTEFGNHLSDTTAVHAVATNLEQKANKGTANGYAGLGVNALVPSTQLAPMPTPPPANYVLRSDQSWGEGAAGAHKASHQNGGGDEISIAGLSGKAADAQTPDSTLVHKTTHENGGGDEISIAGLSGKAADAQTPDSTLTHGNEAHTAAFEVTSAKGAASGYTPLGADSLVPTQYLPAGAIPPNASSTLIALNTPQLIDQLGDTLTFGGIVSGTAIKANWAMRVIITGWIDPHVDATNMQILGKMSQELVETWLCSAVLAFAASPVLGVPFRYEALLVFRAGSLSSANSLGNPTLEARSADISQTWDVTKWTSWQWYVHLGIPLLSVHVSGRQCILEPFG